MQVQVRIEADELIEKINEFNRVANELLNFLETTENVSVTITINNKQQKVDVEIEKLAECLSEYLERETRNPTTWF